MSPVDRRLPTGVRDIVTAGREALDPLPTCQELAAQPAQVRQVVLDGLRGELYALAAVVSERSTRRAWGLRSSYPPLGLPRSRGPQPAPAERDSVTGFADLARAFPATVSRCLEQELADMHESELAWVIGRLDRLLALYRIDAAGTGQARLRDTLSFMHHGLEFGAGFIVEMVEAMTRLLESSGKLTATLTAAEKAEVIRRSIHALSPMTVVNREDLPLAYRHLRGADGAAASPRLSVACFVVERDHGRPHRIAMRAGADLGGDEAPGRAATEDDGGPRYRTRGCPARSSPSGGPAPIVILWNWCIDLALGIDLITDD